MGVRDLGAGKIKLISPVADISNGDRSRIGTELKAKGMNRTQASSMSLRDLLDPDRSTIRLNGVTTRAIANRRLRA